MKDSNQQPPPELYESHTTRRGDSEFTASSPTQAFLAGVPSPNLFLQYTPEYAWLSGSVM